VVFFGNWLISVALNACSGGRVKKLSLDHTLNVCGLVVQAVYLALCKVGLQFLECRSHAAAPKTLLAYPSVECWSDEHTSMAPAGFAAIAVYMFGVFAAFSYINAIAPRWYGVSERFRNRYRFLVVRWRPDKWYWGMIKSFTNLLITLVPIGVADDGVLQVSAVLLILGASMILQAVNCPWRDVQNNWADQAMQAALCVFYVICLAFTEDSQTSNDIQVRRYIGRMVNYIVLTNAVLCLWLLAYVLFLFRTKEMQLEARMGAVTGLATVLAVLSRKLHGTDAEWFASRMEHYSNGDLRQLEEAELLLNYCTATSQFTQRRSSLVSATFRDLYWQDARPAEQKYASAFNSFSNNSNLSAIISKAKCVVPTFASLELGKWNSKPSQTASSFSSASPSLASHSAERAEQLPNLMQGLDKETTCQSLEEEDVQPSKEARKQKKNEPRNSASDQLSGEPLNLAAAVLPSLLEVAVADEADSRMSPPTCLQQEQTANHAKGREPDQSLRAGSVVRV